MLEERLETYQAIDAMIRSHPDSNDAVYWLLTLDYGIRKTHALLDWQVGDQTAPGTGKGTTIRAAITRQKTGAEASVFLCSDWRGEFEQLPTVLTNMIERFCTRFAKRTSM